MACATVTPTSERILEFSGDITDKSQAAVLPRTQLEMRKIRRTRMTVVRSEVATGFHLNTKMGSPTCFKYLKQFQVCFVVLILTDQVSYFFKFPQGYYELIILLIKSCRTLAT